MADRGDTHYRVGNLNLWFAVSSVLLFLTSVWMVVADYNRPWKLYQREFRHIELEQAKAALASDRLQKQAATEAEARAAVAGAEAALQARHDDLAAAEEAQRQAKGAYDIADQAAKFAKAEYDWERYRVEEHRLEHSDPTWGQAPLEAHYQAMQKSARAKEDAALAMAAAQKAVADLERGVTDAEKQAKSSAKELDLLRQKVAKLEPTGAVAVAEHVRDFPGLDFIGPNLRVQKAVLKNLTFELNFTKKQRIDMCMTCHVGIDRAGFEDEPQPHTTHPRLDLYLTAKSPHALRDVGCTICHRGDGESLSFVHADHRPRDEQQRATWEEEHGWHKQHHWDYPMLGATYVEASCVQCHKSSMELIADAAPTVSEGYRLFERYGCYACHKVDWFPTKRKPGPSLANLQAKLVPEFVAAWVAAPRSFRPTTWMPQIFHLENYAAAEPVVKAEYGAGREILGQEWNDAAVLAVTRFLFARHPKKELPPVPVAGDAVRGREGFRLAGCLACHNVSPYDGAKPPISGGDLALERRFENEHGPNLRGVATKLDPTWLYWWIKDPAAYWPDTRMPNLRLSDEDAADIAAYITADPDGFFHDVPQGWKAGLPAIEPAVLSEVLREQARWFFSRDGRGVLEKRFRGEDAAKRWDRNEDLLVAVGERFVLQQGCYSCHEIAGLENTMPIGVELTNWGSKTVDKLDFGFVHKQKEEALGWDHHQTENYLSYRENWLEQKLHAPRSFDARKEKNPTEKLRMPWFGFSQEQVQAIATFVVGLVDDEVQRAKMLPSEEQLASDAGLRAIRQKNCAACHVLEPGLVTFATEGGAERTVAAELVPFEGEKLPPRADRFDEYVADYVAYMRDPEGGDDAAFELEEVTLRLLRPEPGLGDVGKALTVPAKGLRVKPAWGGDFVDVVADYYKRPLAYDEAGNATSRTPDPEGGVRDVDGKYRNVSEEPYDKLRWTYAPPVLIGEGDKLQRDWFYSFLNDPLPLRRQMRVRMPTFHFAEGEAGAIADTFASRARTAWPSDYARRLRLHEGLSLDELAAASAADPATTLPAAALAGVEAGSPIDISTGAAKLVALGQARGFHEMPGPNAPGYERSVRRSPSHIGALLSADPGHLATGEKLAREGPGCFSCHFYRGAPPSNDQPIAWAPDLDRARERLREDWVREWLEDPAKIYPGTAMPANFPPGAVQYQNVVPDTTRDEQLDLILDWLFNLDRLGLPAGM